MKSNIQLINTLTIIFILFSSNLFSQQEGKNGYMIPVKDTIRMFIVYVEVDYTSGNDPFTPSYWPIDLNGKTLPPADADSLFDPVVPVDGILKGWISGIYQDASMNNYYLLGDYYPEVITVPENFQDIETVIDSLNNRDPLSPTLTTAHGLTLNDFDYYQIEGTSAGQVKPKYSNNKIDVILFIWRNKSGWICTAGNGLGQSSGYFNTAIKNMNGFESSASYNACGDAKGSINIILAEHFHGMYGGNNWHTAGGAGTHNFMGIPHTYSLSGQSQSTMRFVNGFDRWFLDWKHPLKTHVLSAKDISMNEVSSDWSIQNHPNDSIFVLEDFVTTGDAIRIKLPHIENTNALPQYLWLENRRMNTRYDVFYDESCADNNNGMFPRGTPGLYAFIQVGRENKIGTGIYNGNASYIFPLSAEGSYDFNYRFDLTQAGDVNICGNWGNPNIPIDKATSLPNAFTGHSDLYNIPPNLNGSNIIVNPGSFAGLSEVFNGIVVHNANMFGDWEDAFCFATNNTKIGLAHNPAPVTVYTQTANYVDKTVSLSPTNNKTIWLNGISIEILSETPNMILKIKWNDYEIDNDVRWCGNVVLKNDVNDPDNNISKINLKMGKTLKLDQGTAPSKPTATITQDNKFLFADPTILTLESGTITTIEDGAELLVNNESTLHIKSGATVIVKGSGKITINNGSFLCVESGANINLQTVNSQINIVDGNIGINPILSSSGNCIGFCEIANLITGLGSITGKTIADAGIDQLACPNPANNILGGNPSAVSGVAPFTYSWSPTTNLNDPTSSNPFLTTALTTNSSYVLQVTDANGCIGVDTINLTYNPLTTITTSTTNSPCPGTGTATVNVCGNPDAYTYYWNDPQFQTTQTATGLFSGTYTVQVTDANGNVTTVNAIVNPTHTTPVYDYVNPVITGSVTWNNPSSIIKVKGEVIVEAGGVLTINSSNVEFSYDLINELGVFYPRARITLQRGGKLIVNNSTLTGCSDGRWDGIEVWGTADNSLRTTAVQGFAKLTNSTVKNALRGVYCNRSIRLNERTAIFQGGRLEVDNCQFINNRNSIILGSYAYNSQNYIKNSTFKYTYNNTFTNYDKIRGDGEFFDVVFIQVGNNKISSISDNVFSDINSQESVIGIRSEDVNFLPISTNTFNDLSIGVDALGVNSLQGIGINQNIFKRCKKGIYAKGITGSSLNQNTFNVPSSPTDTTYGMYLLDCNMYSVQENTFNGTPANNMVGLYIYNTDVANNTQTNQVYRNTFNNLSYASFGNGVNSNAGDPTKGLTFKCNTYVGNDFDILTTVAPGIATRQGAAGSSTTPAGNKFTDACGAITDGELFNAAVIGTQPNSYQYWYHNTLTYIPDAGCYTPFQVQPNNAGVQFEASGPGESCPTNFGGCGGACRDSIRLIQFANTNTINQLTTTLDGGNTTALTTAITAGTTSAGQLKNLLLQNSPLSSVVLMALINSNYSAGIIKEVLLQNSPLSNQLLYALLIRQPQLSSGIVKDILRQSAPLAPEILNLAMANNYPGGITNQITNNQQNAPLPPSVTQLTEGYIGELTRENNLLTNRLVRSFLHDVEDEYRFDSISVLLKTGGGIIPPGVCKTCAIEADVIGKNYTAALQEITALEQQGSELEFTSLQRTLIDMETMPDKLMSIKTDTVLKNKVEAVAIQTTKKGSINARNLLDMAFKQKVKETFHFPQNNNTARLINPVKNESEDNKLKSINNLESNELFNLYPNPNQGTFTLLHITQEKESSYLSIIDFTGRMVYQQTLSAKQQGKETINMTHLPTGIYFIRISGVEGKLLYTNKLSITK
ncbi:MAG: T9SS type A sorting domain-containing protein [Flavobacteriales bacterium]|nr:T9SS type A sorting domain-containing protein [Flavobacteriales bacterium]